MPACVSQGTEELEKRCWLSIWWLFFHGIESKRNTFQKRTPESPLGGMMSAVMCSSVTALALSTASALTAVLLC